MNHVYTRSIVIVALAAATLLAWHAFAQTSYVAESAGLFSGVSDTGSLQDAIDAAVIAAHEGLCPDCADFQVQWQLQDVRGRNGGFAYTNEITVTIRAR